MQEIDAILRDHRTDEIYPIDTDQLDLLYLLKAEVRGRNAFEIISGYRSPPTNAALRKNSSGVARRSYHMQGKAIDIRLPGRDLKNLRKTALAMRAGGVGYYPDANLIHVDAGPYRSWQFPAGHLQFFVVSCNSFFPRAAALSCFDLVILPGSRLLLTMSF